MPQSPLEEIHNSINVGETIRNMFSPERIDTLVKRRPCLVFEVKSNNEGTGSIYVLLPVTHFSGKSILEADIMPDKKKYNLPIAPNNVDVFDRAPLNTIPAWPDSFSYQVLVPISVSPDQVLSRFGRQTILPEIELSRIQSFFAERGEIQAISLQNRYTTEECLIPIELTPGITEDVDPSATIRDDIDFINGMVDTLVKDKEAGGDLLDNVMETLENQWVEVGSGKRSVRINMGAPEASAPHDPRARGSASNRRGPRGRRGGTAMGRRGSGLPNESAAMSQTVTRGRGRRRPVAANRGRVRGGPSGHGRYTGGDK